MTYSPGFELEPSVKPIPSSISATSLIMPIEPQSITRSLRVVKALGIAQCALEQRAIQHQAIDALGGVEGLARHGGDIGKPARRHLVDQGIVCQSALQHLAVARSETRRTEWTTATCSNRS